MTRPLPDVADPEFAPFWVGTKAREIRIVFCSQCQHPRWPPRPICANCGSFEFDWRKVGTTGRLYTWTVVQHQTTAGLPPPYAVGLVELEDHPQVRLLGQIVGDVSALSVGMRLVAQFEQLSDSVTLVNWARATGQMGMTAT